MATTPYAVRLTHTFLCEDQLGRFRFTCPEGYVFRAGQFLELTVGTREGPVTHLLSIASIPAEGYLEVCTRLTGSPFKDALVALQPGDTVAISAARGTLALPGQGRASVLLAGGVGVVPVRSLITDAVTRSGVGRLVLFQADRSATCMPYAEELDALSRSGALVRIPVIDRMEPGWRGETGHISAQMIRSRLPEDMDGARWVVAGPPGMVNGMRDVLAELGIPATDVAIERFTGYE